MGGECRRRRATQRAVEDGVGLRGHSVNSLQLQVVVLHARVVHSKTSPVGRNSGRVADGRESLKGDRRELLLGGQGLEVLVVLPGPKASNSELTRDWGES